MPLRLEDLPPEIRRRIAASDAVLGAAHDGVSAAVSTARRLDPPKEGAWICGTCPYRPRSWADAERHADRTGHHRIEVRLDA